MAELCAASPASGTRRSSLDDPEQQQQQQARRSTSSGMSTSSGGGGGNALAAAAGPPGAGRDSRRASGAGGAAAEECGEGGACGGRDEGEAALQRLLSSALNLPDDGQLARQLQLLRPCSPPADGGSAAGPSAPAAAAAHLQPQPGAAAPPQLAVLQPPQLPALRTSAFMPASAFGSAPAGGALLCASPSDCGSVLGSSGFGGAFGASHTLGGGGGGMSTLVSSSTTTAGCSSTSSARNTLRIWDSLNFGVSEAAGGEGDSGSGDGRARSSGGAGGGVASLPGCDSVMLAAVYGSEGAGLGLGLEEDVVGTPLATDGAGGPAGLPDLSRLELTDALAAAPAPPQQHQQRSLLQPQMVAHEQQQQQQQQHSPPSTALALAAPSISTSSSSSATTATAAALAASRLALLCEAVRFEHFTVPQLMAVQAEGLVPPALLHAALWQRTCLDLHIHQRATAAAPDGAGGGAASLDTPRAGQQAQQQGLQQGHRPFRMCWRLHCGAIKKLAAGDMLQSEPQQYAGALWQV